ncbi:hypothetical protein CCP3SC1_2200004 [Gammaproteobacteria bacterium]
MARAVPCNPRLMAPGFSKDARFHLFALRA